MISRKNIWLLNMLSTVNLVFAMTVAAFLGITPVYALDLTVNYRLYNPNSGEHFYTNSATERDRIVSCGWKYEGIGWSSPVNGEPVFRLYNPNAGDHFYTKDSAEKSSLVAAGWQYEGIGWYSADSSSYPVYRQYNPNAKTGSHNYTTSTAERDALINAGWKDEGIAWYATSGAESDPTYIVSSAKTNQGTGGNLSIPTLGIDVALYKGSSQAIVDAEDSAAIFNLERRPIIADHASQSFKPLRMALEKEAVITNGDEETKYVCRSVAKGTNTGHELVINGHSAENEACDLIMYTCVSSDGHDIWISFWDKE